MKKSAQSAPLRGRRLPWLGRDDDGTLFYSKHPDPAGTLTWHRLEAWRWRQRRRILHDVHRGEAWYLYQLGAAAQPAVTAVPDRAESTARPVPAIVGARRA